MTIVLILSFGMFSCKDRIDKESPIILNFINKKWIGTKIDFPSTIIPLRDTVSKSKQGRYRIVGFYDGHCSMCYAQLIKWQKTIKNYKEEGFKNVNFMFIFSGNSKGYVEYSINQLGFPLDLVYYDSKDVFNSQYSFLEESEYKYSSMLLDENDNVLFIGNPTISKEDNNTFLKIIKNH